MNVRTRPVVQLVCPVHGGEVLPLPFAPVGAVFCARCGREPWWVWLT